tara:strand:- start:991 stop:3666 length:2676 start_codon:yes stop_codon:yes gene_type:complete
MAFTISGSIITQTGTDTNLSGLSAIAGVIHHSWSGLDIYDLDTNNLGLDAQGTLTIGGDNTFNTNEKLIISEGTPTGGKRLEVTNGGTLNLGFLFAEGGDTEAITDKVLVFQPGINKGFGQSNSGNYGTGTTFGIANGGTLNWFSGTVDIWGAMGFQAGSFPNIGFSTKTKPVFDQTRVRRGLSSPAQILYSHTANLNVNGWKHKGIIKTNAKGSGLTLAAVPTQFKGYEPIFMASAFSGSSLIPSGTYPVSDYAGIVGSGADFQNKAGASAILKFINSDVGSDMSVLDNNGLLDPLVVQVVRATASDLTTNAVATTGKIYIERDDGTNSQIATNDGLGSYDFGEVEVAFSASGIISGAEKFFGENDDTTIRHINYETLIANVPVTLRGADGLDVVFKTSLDGSITETDKTIVDAYTTIDNAQAFYDKAKSYLTDNYAGETETILTRSGNTIDTGAYNVTIVQVGSAFAFNGTTITINTNSFVGNIITTGLVTGKGVVTGFVFDNTQDSSVSDVSGNTFKVYASASDRDGRTNAIATDVTSYSFVFASIPANPLYFWVQSGSTELPTELTVAQGSNTLDLGTGALLTALPLEVDKALANRIDGIDLPNIVAVATRTELNAELNLITANLDKQISTLNDFNPAASTVITDTASRNASKANVSGLSTFNAVTDTVTAGNMRGTDNANTVIPDNTKIGLIKTKVDTLVNTNLTGIALTTDITNLNDITASEVVAAMQVVKDDFKADVSALSTFDSATDTVTAGNMRGTDNANTVIPDNTSISTILVDTNELQANQNNWNTATGFSTFDNATDSVITDVASRNASKADVSALISSQVAQTVQITAIEAATNDISDFKGLTLGSPATFTPTGIVAGAKSVTITGNGITSTTVTRDA